MINNTVAANFKACVQSKVIRFALFVFVVFFAAAFIASRVFGLYVNTTDSVKRGIYMLDEGNATQKALGDIVVIQKNKLPYLEEHRTNKAPFLLKQVLGVPGDVIDYRDNCIFINGKAKKGMEIIKIDKLKHKIFCVLKFPVQVPKENYFVGSSVRTGYDSRYWGFCPNNAIKGKVKLIYEF